MIDAAIPLQTQAPNVLGQIGQLQNIGAAQQQAKLRDIGIQNAQVGLQGDQLKLGVEQQGVQDEANVRAATAAATDPQTGQLDKQLQLSTLAKLNPTAAQRLSSSYAIQDTAAQEAQQKLSQAKLQTAMETNSAMDKVLQGVADQPSYTNALQHAHALGIDVSQFPPQYDPQIVARAHQQVLSTQDLLKQKNEEMTQQQAAQAEKDRAAQAAATLANTQQYQKQEIGIRKQEVGIQGARLGLERQKQQMEMGTGADANSLADAITSGHIAPERMAYLIAKNPGLLNAVMQKDPNFDSSKVGAYAQAYKDFTSSKAGTAGGALNAGATALGHLKELQDMNTVASHIPGTAAHNAYMNKVDTVATELAKFYGDSTVSGIGAIRSTLASNLPGTRQAAIATQAQSMGDKFDAYQQTWDNAAPSKAYEAPMPGISDAAKAARAALDPRYKPQQAQSGNTVTAPNGKTYNFPDAASAAKFKAAAGIQ